MANELRTLSRKERFYLDTMDNAKQFMEFYVAERHSSQLSGWKQRVDNLYQDFQQNRLAIEIALDEAGLLKRGETTETAPTDDTNEVAEENNRFIRQQFELDYVLVVSFLVNESQKMKTALPSQLLHPAFPKPQSRLKLPEVKLPSFDGNISDWITFRDSFKSLIDDNPQLSQFDKFSYLLASLTKDAKKIIDSVELSAANYPVAWQLLEKRFDNKKLVVKNYLDVLFAIEPMKKESYESLMRLVDDFERNLSMIDKMGVPTDGWNEILAYMLCSRLDPMTLKQWETHFRSNEVPEYKDVITFLHSHLSILQSLAPSKSRSTESPKSEQSRQLKSKPSNVHAVMTSATSSCPFCSKISHSPYRCDVFQKMSVSQRFEEVKKNKLCINCLSSSHMLASCKSSTCRVCNRKHHTMLHQTNERSLLQSKASSPSTESASSSHSVQAESTSNKTSSQSAQSSSAEIKSPSAPVASLVSTTPVGCTRRVPATVLLQTAIVKIFTSAEHFIWARALLDPASQLSLITESLVQKLKLRRYQCHQEIGGVGNSTIVSSHAVVVRLGSHCSEFTADQSCHILKRITRDLPTGFIDTTAWKLPSGITLADPKFHEPGPIDLLLGMELYYDLLIEGFIKLGPEQPILQNTVFGWVASGKIGNGTSGVTPKVAHVCNESTQESLYDLLSRFWEIESCWSVSTASLEESACEDHFKANTFRDEVGRFVVTLPKRSSILAQLGNSKEIATKRFLSLERRLEANPRMKQAYTAFIDEYRQLDHMRELDESNTSSSLSFYLPHLGVEKADSTTTKLRVVFDASCRTDTGVSLNQALMVGPVIQDDLFAITLRFRMNRIAIIADIEKMYRQIRINPSDYPLQRILWRSSIAEPLRTFELTTVTYGTASAPFLATRCLKELSQQNSDQYPVTARILAKDFYMDDLLTGVDDEEDAEELYKQLLQLMKSAGLSLRKWATNSSIILSKIPAELRDERTKVTLNAPSIPIKTLGLRWEPSSDSYSYAVPKWSSESIITRRIVVADAARLFVPLGLVGPVVVIAKIFIQSLWRSTTSWDQPLTDEEQQYWNKFRNNLADIVTITIPRWVVATRDPVLIELHGFCDASEKAYGACLYVRTVSSDGTISVRLLCAKSKVAPLGNSKGEPKLSLPRLELSSALLLSHLYHKTNASIQLNTKPFFWTDSMISLYQIKSPPSRWKTFVANRCSEVQRLTVGGTWAHVPGIENPADIISRGMSPAQLKDTVCWWEGPHWLSQPSRSWPPLNIAIPDPSAKISEERSVALPVQMRPTNEVFSLRSSFSKLVRLIAYIRRFVHNASPRNRNRRKLGMLVPSELTDATKTLVRIAQHEMFSRELAEIRSNGQVGNHSKLKTLFPVLVDGVLRVGGRLRHAPISEDRKHPMILPERHPLTECIMIHYHEKSHHAGPQLLIASIREKFWPLRVRNLARKVVHSCIACFRTKPSNLEQLMGDLPPERVTPTLAFRRCGVDLCGPFKYRNRRRAPPVQCYVAIFVCLTTKAVHIELVYDLSTAAFIAALHRFIARRGNPTLIECDNATNFRGAARELAALRRQFENQQHQTAVINNLANDGIQFKFIPPRTPHFGGLWEAAVKSFKRHLRSTVGNAILTQDEFVTLLCRIEACLNSRPLTPLSADPDDLEILTPGHFLIHRPLTSHPEPDLSDIPRNRLGPWQENQELLRRIWKRWSTDYLSGLHPRTRWTQLRDNIKVGVMVLLKEDNLPPLKWRYGRIIHVVRGDDNNIRVVKVRTADGNEFTRGISKICVLPIHPHSSHSAGDVNPDSN